jgi:RsiW-degrading membrane proteinase PrsW (M82 family)
MDPLIFAILAAFIPAFGWLVYFYRKDKLNPEPTRVVIAFFIWGGAFAVPAALLLATVTETTVESLSIDTTGFIGVFLLFFLVAGLPEETMKGLLAAFRARKEPNVDEPADPMLYFTSLGLGFGAVETTLYLLMFSDQFAEVAILRAVTATVGHGLWTGIAGYFYGAKRFGMNRYMGLISGILIAAAVHGLYDAATNYDLLVAIGVLVVTALAYGWLFKNALKHSPNAVVLAQPAVPPAVPPSAPPA